jgi:hypothetical protein
VWVDSSDRKVRDLYASTWNRQQDERTRLFRRSGVDAVEIPIDKSYITPLQAFFRVREKRW